ncbi:OSBPL8 family protein [Megaselia abdita]
MNRNDNLPSSMTSNTTPMKTSSIGITGQSSEVPARGMTPPQSASTPAPPTIHSGSSSSFYGSTTALTVTPPNSAAVTNWSDTSSTKLDSIAPDRTPGDSKLNRKESYKAQRKNYRKEKKRVASELMNSLQDPAVIVLADWLKVRGTLKSWTKLWCVLKPGLLLIYKSPKTKSSHWVGTVLLTSCQVIERPSKKDGFCFKLFHPMDQSIWAPRGPEKETIGAVTQPLPTAYLIFRAPSQAAGKCWMDALELSLRCSAMLLRSNSGSGGPNTTSDSTIDPSLGDVISHETQWSEADYEKHFKEHDLDADSQNEGVAANVSGPETESDSDNGEMEDVVDEDFTSETPFILTEEEEFGSAGEQVEELPEEHKSLIWFLMKQVRPGMDLSKVVLPTFILEPRSFLDKLSDSYYHADYLSRAAHEDDPFTRMKTVVSWYLSGFYKKPKGLKKPYNPILGETYRCYWEHENGSRTYYISEQVSHHPPISAFYVTNRQDGFCISCSMLAKSKFYGNSTSAVLDGLATLTLLPRGESYTLNSPYAHCKGILMGTLSMELGGKVSIECNNTGYKTEIEFKLKPFLGGSEYTNLVSGKIKLGKETLATLNGHWDTEMKIKDSKTGEESILFSATKETKQQRLKRFVVPIQSQAPTESERLWQLVSAAIKRDDQVGATEEKTILEEAQRNAAKERKATCTEWVPVHFQQDMGTGQWIYKYADLRPWDPRNDVRQYEADYRILTKTRHQAPMIRKASIISSEAFHSRQSLSVLKNKRGVGLLKSKSKNLDESIIHSDSSQSNVDEVDDTVKLGYTSSINKIMKTMAAMNENMEKQSKELQFIRMKLDRVEMATSGQHKFLGLKISQTILMKTMIWAFVGIFISFIFKFFK